MRHVTKYVYVMKCVTMDSGMNCITEVTKMQEMLLDRRTQSLVNDYVPEGEILDELVCFFTIFADYTRLRMISALAISEMCVTDLSRLLRLNQTTVSHQLRLLRNAHLVKTRREGKSIFYSLDDDHVVTIMSQGLAHIRHTGR